MKTTIRHIFLGLALAAGLILPAAPAARAAPAATVTIYEQCDTYGWCPNFWGGGLALSAYHGTTRNNAIRIQSIPGTGNFQLLDQVHGGCVGDSLGSQNTHRAAGGNTCNSTATGTGGDWGTRFQRISDAICPAGYYKYWNYHWLAYLGYVDGSGNAVYLDTRGNCLEQKSFAA